VEEVREARAHGTKHAGDHESGAHEAEVLGVGVVVLLEEAGLVRVRASVRVGVKVKKVSSVRVRVRVAGRGFG